MLEKLLQNAVLILFVSLPVGVAGLQAEVPPRLDAERDQTAPLWISAQVFAPDGGWNAGAVPESARMRLERKVAEAKDHRERSSESRSADPVSRRCVVWSLLSGARVPLDGQSVRGLFDDSFRVYVGTITDTQPGLVNGFPASLLEIEVDDELKEPASESPGRVLLHFEPTELLIDGEYLCTKSERYPDLPTVGSRILVFQRQPSEGLVLTSRNTEIVYQRLGHSVSFPSDLSSETGEPRAGLDELVQYLAQGLDPEAQGK